MTLILKSWRTAYKLTDQNGQTHNGCQWGPKVKNPMGKLSGQGGLCGPGFYHAYVSPEMAAFLNPIHANITDPILWEMRIRGKVELDGPDGVLKLGATEAETIRTLPMIVPTPIQRVLFSVYNGAAALEAAGLEIPGWDAWADNVLVDPAHIFNASAARSAAWSAARSAESAARSAESAAWSAASAASAARSAESAAILRDAAAFALSYTDK